MPLGAQIGPLFAEMSALAEALFCSVTANLGPQDEVSLDVPLTNRDGIALAERHRLTPFFGPLVGRRSSAQPLADFAGAMSKELKAMATTPEHVAYLREIRRRDRRATSATRSRYASIDSSWIIVLAAGAAVALVEAIDLASWVAPVLGRSRGRPRLDQVFGRTSEGSKPMDLLRRRLAHEQRLVLVRGGPYATVGEPMKLFIERCERLLTENDATMVDYFASLTEPPAENQPA